ncbi:MAG: C1 family peptidase [Bacteroides sp.]|nr:C1 family peptidase [Roseburia sp.]MCM1347429.1 C1 family peptidase [Bacteroides sp.]MCM1421898.1 C1 family peptidase [Bacteroides sp.]
MRKTFVTISFCALGLCAVAQGGISEDMLGRMKSQNKMTASDKALRNALAVNDIRALALNQDNMAEMNTFFSHSVPSKGITDQKSSGRCWLFTGLNVMRSRMILDQGLEGMEFSQNYLFFFDQLEKSNLFLQAVIDTRKKPMEDKTVEWLFRNPLSDGGTFTGVADLVSKYGVVPKGVMQETYASNNTSRFTSLIKRKLREDALALRGSNAKDADLQKMKEEMLGDIYHILVLGFGEPVTEFAWAPKNADGSYKYEPKKYTPKSFYQEMIGENLHDDYVMLMNDPTREYWKTYEIEYDRHTYDGHNWKYLNLPMEDIKEAAVASIKDSTMMYLSCDVGKELDSSRGLLDMNNYDYSSILGVEFTMDKKQRIQTFDSSSSHAMTLKAVDLDAEGKPVKWEVENSWGPSSGFNGHLIMTDEWFDEYLFRLVVKKKYLSDKIVKASEQKPVKLPCWDPMFACEE